MSITAQQIKETADGSLTDVKKLLNSGDVEGAQISGFIAIAQSNFLIAEQLAIFNERNE